MPIDVKICGLSSAAAVEAAVGGGARFTGFVFYPPSPRSLDRELDLAADLTARVPAGITKVGLFVDPDDAMLDRVLDKVPLDWIQLHGEETPERTAAVHARTGRPVMKAIKVSSAAQIEAAAAYTESAAWLLFDAKAPDDMAGALPGGNALAFDWTLLADARPPLPWMLAGGLHAGNLAQAVAASGARTVDVSSGVEDRPGVKNPQKIKAFLAAAHALAPALD